MLQNTNSVSQLALVLTEYKLQALVDDILPLEEGAGKRCSECGLNVVASVTKGHQRKGGQFFIFFLLCILVHSCEKQNFLWEIWVNSLL